MCKKKSKLLAAGASIQTPRGELTALPKLLKWLGGTRCPTSPPLSPLRPACSTVTINYVSTNSKSKVQNMRKGAKAPTEILQIVFNFDRLKNYFTGMLYRKCAIKPSLKISLHLKHVVTLSCHQRARGRKIYEDRPGRPMGR